MPGSEYAKAPTDPKEKAERSEIRKLIYAFCKAHGICTGCRVRWSRNAGTRCQRCADVNVKHAALSRTRAKARKKASVDKSGWLNYLDSPRP